ncbi:MAG: hypothetical protein N5P05_000084 [Chroococcopsis gigantea SAG 12.99]|jgi:thioesterase domain-containing protein/acyl carrier protein|nr:hypothetical protein [Chlorogloea purpurea SAG 13.99]MDV2998478.1 hypothetical protein [Chroococcopsis gigantea SAG 12.99]
MKTIDSFLSELRQRNVQIWLDGDRVRYRAPKDSLSGELLSELKERKGEILCLLQQIGERVQNENPPIVSISREQELPVSLSQRRFWWQSQLEPDSAINNMPYVYSLRGSLDISLLEKSQNEIIRRHEILRMNLITLDGQPSIAIASELFLSIPVIDLQELSAPLRSDEAKRLANEEVRKPFSLDHHPLLRLKLLRLDKDYHILLVNLHRAVCDGVSIDIFFRELITLYRDFTHDQPPSLPPLPIQYVDFAYWQSQRLRGKLWESHVKYWKQQLGGNLPVVQLPTDFQRPPLPTYRGARLCQILPRSLNEKLNILSQKTGTTLFMLLLTAFQLLIYHYTKQEDIIISYSKSGRERLETEGLIGPFSNTLILRTLLDKNLKFPELLVRVRQSILEADLYQYFPFEKLVEEIKWEGNSERSPLLQLLFALNPPWVNDVAQGEVQLPDLTLTSLFGYVYVGETKFDLTLVMRETTAGLRTVFEYNADIFKESTIIRFLTDFEALLFRLVDDPDRDIVSLAQPLAQTKLSHRLPPRIEDSKENNIYISSRDEIESKLTHIWQEVMGMRPIGIKDNFFALGGNSLLAVRLCERIQQTFQNNLSLSAIFQAPSIEELAKIIRRRTQLPSWYSLVPIQPQGSRPPLFGIHYLKFHDLSRHLGKDQPIYGLRYGIAESIDKTFSSLPSIEDLAAHFIEEARFIQPQGPYFLMGHSFGGMVAYEMAQQLRASGLGVGLLVLFDTYIESVAEGLPLPFPTRFHNLLKLGPAEFMKRSLKIFQDFRHDYFERKPTLETDNLYYPHFHTAEPLNAIRLTYSPKPYNGQVILFQSIHRSINYSVIPPEDGLKKFVGDNLQVYNVPGNHGSLLEEPHIKLTAKKLKNLLKS